MRKRDFTLEELHQFNGEGPDKRILIAVNYKVFDVTNKGQELYGRGASYASFAGKDASRALACFTLEGCVVKSGYDDLSDLTPDQMKTLREWELQFSERYDYVGRLLKPGEPHRVYEEEDEQQRSSSRDESISSKLKSS